MRPRAVITGVGVIASNGMTTEEFFQSIIDGNSGLQKRNRLEKWGAGSCFVGQVDHVFEELTSPSDSETLVQLAYVAIDQAMKDSGLTREDFLSAGTRAGLSVSTSLAGNEKMMRFVSSKISNEYIDPDWLIASPNYISEIADYVGVRGPAYSTVSACAAGTAGAGIALDMIRNGTIDVAVIVGTDAVLDFSIAGFYSLQSMTESGCKPFDEKRDGMALGEGAAALVIESLDRAKARGSHIYGELLGYGLGNDAYHITSPDPNGDGAYRTMVMALQDAGLEVDQIDYINAHGTATELNDIMEINAITKLFGSSNPNLLISSSKSSTGHCLGAAGSVELLVALLAVDRGIVPPTVNLTKPPEQFSSCNLVKEEAIKKEVLYVMSNSFAFSGNSASIIVGKVSNEDLQIIS